MNRVLIVLPNAERVTEQLYEQAAQGADVDFSRRIVVSDDVEQHYLTEDLYQRGWHRGKTYSDVIRLREFTGRHTPREKS